MPAGTADLVGDIAHLTGWHPDIIFDLPLVQALHYQLKSRLLRGGVMEWAL